MADRADEEPKEAARRMRTIAAEFTATVSRALAAITATWRT